MAVIKYGSIVTGGSGSLGGSTLQPCLSGNIWRNKPQQTYSRTPAQAIIRGYNKTMQAGWRALTDQSRQIWNDYAKSKPVFNRSGEKHPLSGHSLWMKYQYVYCKENFPFQLDPFKAQSGPLGPELIKNGSFDDASYWILSPLSSIHDGALYAQAPPVGYGFNHQSPVLSYAGLSYRLITDCLTKNGWFYFMTGATPYQIIDIGCNVYTFNQIVNRSSVYVYCRDGSSGVLSYISFKQIL